MPRMDKLSPYRTTWTETEKALVVCYVKTNIVQYDKKAETITLNSGGWLTVTTKRKMQQASNQFALGYTVHQHKGDWYVTRRQDGKQWPFMDGMTFDRWPTKEA